MKKILLVDYGSHYFKDVVECMRRLDVECIEVKHDDDLEGLKDKLCGIILTGSPGRVNNPEDPRLDPRLLDMNVPVLGICYGLQLLTHALGGRVEALDQRDLGLGEMTITVRSPLNKDLPDHVQVWMAHYDHVTRLAEGFQAYATTPVSIAMAGYEAKRWYGIQYHPEAKKQKDDMQVFKNFIFDICGYKKEELFL